MQRYLSALWLALLAPLAFALDQPSSWVENTAKTILAEISAADLDIEDKAGQADLAERIIIPNVDVEGIAMRAVGRPWRQVEQNDRDRFVVGMKTNLLSLYGGAFSQFKAADLEILSERVAKRGDRAIVNTRLRRPGEDWLAAEFRLIADGNQWRVLDVAIEGVSLLSSYKAQFDERVSRLGLDGAINEVAAGR